MQISNNDVDVMVVDILRHGECEGGHIYRGATDVALSSLGFEQMSSVAERAYLTNPWDLIISSPLKRCLEFAEYLQAKHCAAVHVENDFREMDFGRWEGRLIKEVWEEERESVENFYRDPLQYSPPGGESVAAVLERLTSAWSTRIESSEYKKVLLIQHGGTIRILLAWLLGLDIKNISRIEVPYAGLSRVKVYKSAGITQAVVSSVNGFVPDEIS